MGNIKIRGDPLPVVKWYLNGNEIVDSDTVKTSCKEDEFMYRLDIFDVQSNTAGEIKVVAKNENGEDVKVGSLEVQFATEENGLECTYTLSIKDATLEDAGMYEISCTNRVGHTEKAGTLAVITEEPSFPKPLADITTTLGSTATFVACVAGVPKPTVEWYQGDKVCQGQEKAFGRGAYQRGHHLQDDCERHH